MKGRPDTAIEATRGEAIAESLRRALVFDHIRDGVVVIGLDGVIVDWNAGAERLFGWTRQEALGKPATILDPPATVPDAASGLAAGGAAESADATGERAFIRKDGSIVHCEPAIVPLRDARGEVCAQLAVYHDVTRRREAEQRLADERTLLRTVIDAVPDPIFFKDCDGRYVMHNLADRKMFAPDDEDFLGKTVFDQPGLRDTAKTYHAGDVHVVTTGEPLVNYEEPFTRPDGTKGCFLTSKFPLRDASGRIIGLVGIARDITKRKEAERELANEKQLLRTVLDAVADPIFLKDREGRFVMLNAACLRMWGLENADYAGRTDFDFPGMRANADRYAVDDMAVVRTGQPLINREEPFMLPDGRRGWFLTSKFPLRDAAGEIVGLAGICRDITDFKRAAEELERTRRRLVDHVENSPLGIVEWDADLRVERWSGQAESIFGWSAGEVIGRHFNDRPFMHPEDAPRVKETVGRLLDGSEQRNILQTRNRTKSGRVVHCVWHNSALRDAGGRLVSFLSLVEDVTERVEAEETTHAAAVERAAIERKLQDTQKLESLGVLAGGIAHDFNNLLTGVLGNASLARSELDPDSRTQPCLEQIELAATRAAELCRQMLAYAGKGRFLVRTLDLNQIVRETTDLLRVSISKNVVISYDLAHTLPAILADGTQMRQIVMNLVINAGEAYGDAPGVVRLKTGVMRADRAYFEGAHLAPDLPEGDYVFLEVADEGCGMTPEVMARIFDPFFTTKFTGRGLGLAAVLGIVRGHNGAMKVSSQPGSGTAFRVLLPLAAGPAETAPPAVPAPARWRGKGVALVIDDEELLRAIAKRMLESIGFSVVIAADGAGGVEKFAANAPAISVVLLDLTMPRMDGEAALRELLRIREDARVVLMSGYTEQEAVARFAGQSLAGFLQKPFTLADLRQKLQQVLPAG
jgi:two-component system, cell cycle sensor histidine kinase and response regulator CckA